MRAFPWSETPLGPVSAWSASLRTAVSILLSTRHPMFLWWGPDLIQFYNDSYRHSLGPDRHPSALGQRGRQCWAEIWPIIGGEVESIMAGGPATWHEDYLVPITRGDRVEDVYWSYSYIPVHDDDGTVGGVLVTVQETTQRVLAERRKQVLRELTEAMVPAQTVQEVADRAAAALDGIEDVPLALVYLRDSLTGDHRFAAAAGKPPTTILPSLSAGSDWSQDQWPARILEGSVLPLAREGVAQPYGMVVLGANPRTPLERSYQAFFADVARALTTALAGVRARDQERRTEVHLRSAERLQAVAALAGGVAHEVNNQMTVVLGFGEFVLAALGPNHPQAADMRHVLQAGSRAATISQQLLTFTRQQVTQPQVLELGEAVTALAPVLRQLLGSDKTLAVSPRQGDTFVNADPAQIEQVLINLVANARDATATGGRVTITVEKIDLRESDPGLPGIALIPKTYILLSVADTGCGMDEATLGRIFDPFFTTKDVGQGTGLGLSMVYGIVKRHEGYVWADSAPGVGTTLRLYWPAVLSLPTATAAVKGPPPTVERSAPARLPRSVWVVEDEVAVREIIARTLAGEGIHVVTAEDGAHALRLLGETPMPPSLVITDVIMPHVNGRQVSEAIAARHGDVPVLFISGHASEDVTRRGLLPEDAAFLQKPFTPAELVQALQAVFTRGTMCLPG